MTLMPTEQPDTGVAPTTAGACDEPTAVPLPTDATVVVPDATRTEAAEWAWSIEDETEEIRRRSWREVGGHTAIILGCAAVLSVAVFAWHTVRYHANLQVSAPTATMRPPLSPAPAPTTPPVTTPTVTTPTVTVTQTPTAAPTPTWTPPPERSSPPSLKAAGPPLLDRDQGFLQALRDDDGITAGPNALGAAHWVCGEYRNGVSRDDIAVTIRRANPNLNSLNAAMDFVNTSARFYCPQYAAG